jgi:hypothetical protein
MSGLNGSRTLSRGARAQLGGRSLRSALRIVLRDSPVELLDRLAGDEVLAPQLGPLLHRNHPPAAPPSSWSTTRLGTTSDVSADRPRGSTFARRRGSVFTRRRHRDGLAADVCAAADRHGLSEGTDRRGPRNGECERRRTRRDLTFRCASAARRPCCRRRCAAETVSQRARHRIDSANEIQNRRRKSSVRWSPSPQPTGSDG